MGKRLKKTGIYALGFVKWCALGILMGLMGGLVGAAFHHVLHLVTDLRQENWWLIFFLPLGGLGIAGIYSLRSLRGNKGTNAIIQAVNQKERIDPLVAPAIYLATSLTHLFGGSAGREGAALQIGGSLASSVAGIFRLKDAQRRVLVLCGMAAMFAGLFGTPLTAAIFVLEFATVGTIFTPALLPVMVASMVAADLSAWMGVHPETAVIPAVTIGFANVWRLALLAALVAALGVGMCFVFHKAEHIGAKLLKNRFLRIAVGGALILVLTLLVSDQRYNGAGMEMALGAVEGNAQWFDFALKLLFTAITLGAGFKGGEIVPTFCIGATFGCVAGGLLGLDPGYAGALGLVGLFCSVTNSPLASILLAYEMFGGTNLPAFALMCVICFAISGKGGLYSAQKLLYAKTQMEA